jgi:hypothetical protein
VSDGFDVNGEPAEEQLPAIPCERCGGELGYEPWTDGPAICLACNGDAPAPAASFTVGEKIRSLLDVVLRNPEAPKDATAAATLRAFRTAERFGLTKPVARMFPSLDDEEAWHAWLAIATGVCLELTSDGVELDVEACRRAARLVLAELFA